MRSQKMDVSFDQVNWGALKSFLPYLQAYKARIFLALLCLVGAKVASVGLPFILKHIVDDLDAANQVPDLVLLPIGLLLAYGLARFANVLFGELRDTIFGRVTEKAMRRIGVKVFEHLHALDLEFHLMRRTGGLSREIERGTNGISFLMRFMVFNIVPTLLELGMVMGILALKYPPGFALTILISVVVYIAFSIYATEFRTRFVREVNEAESGSSTQAIDSLLNYETVKYFTNEAYETERYDQQLAVWEKARQKNRLSLFALNAGQAFIIAAAMTVAMVLAAQYTLAGTMTLGDFVLINAFMMQIFMPLNFLGFVYREIKSSMVNIEKMFGLLKQEPAIKDLPDAKTLQITTGEIQFESLQFGYSNDRPILKGVSFTVPAKQKVAVVGSSGAGKSTLLKLLFRFYDLKSGKILIDDQDISGVTQHSLRKVIGVVPQDTVLFNASIIENIRYGKVDASDDDVQSAIRLAHLDTFIESLPKKGETLVGERGLKLSGGEKQRVAIARTILKNPAIIVFDEATSSLDSHSEKKIMAAIDDVSREHTSLVIAHRLSTVVNADKILVMEGGKVVEEGAHEALLAADGVYAGLWQAQQQSESSIP